MSWNIGPAGDCCKLILAAAAAATAAVETLGLYTWLKGLAAAAACNAACC